MRKKLPFYYKINFFFAFLLIFFFLQVKFTYADNPFVISSYSQIEGELNLINFIHETDSRAPQFTTLVEGLPYPRVSKLFQVAGASKPTDAPGDFATLVGFSAGDKNILVPQSGYDIGGGFEVLVVYADSQNITLKYNREDGIAVGYTLYIKNVEVDRDLLNYYNQLNQEGRKTLPTLRAGARIGKAKGEILIAIRDSGTLLDPRWRYDWWDKLPSQNPQDFLPNSLTPISQGGQQCGFSEGGDGTSRPVPCDPCNVAEELTPSCATGFEISGTVKYARCESDCETNGNHFVKREWGGTVVVDPSQTTIPFVGKKEQESEEKYLADYFEGTNEYYKNYQKYWLEWVNYAGVLRKLTPMEYQDNLKKEMIKRIGKKADAGVHNYFLSYTGRLCWDIPFIADMFLDFIQKLSLPIAKDIAGWLADHGHYCIFKDNTLNTALVTSLFGAISIFNSNPLLPDITFRNSDTVSKKLSEVAKPPNPYEESYLEKLEEWKKNPENVRIWQVVPLVSREDTPGYIYPYIGTKAYDEVSISNPEAMIEKVPHVARLSEAAEIIQNLLLPFTSNSDSGFLAKKSNPEITQSYNQEKVLGKKIYLSQGGASQCISINPSSNYSMVGGGASVNVTVVYKQEVDQGHGMHFQPLVNGGNPLGAFVVVDKNMPFTLTPPWTATPFTLAPGESKTITYGFQTWECDAAGGAASGSLACTFSLSANGEFSTNCGAPSAPPSESCSVGQPQPVDSCNRSGIRDPNPNDGLCCGPINLEFKGVDYVENKDYCNHECLKYKTIYDPISGMPKEICEEWCPCEKDQKADVSRKGGVALYHPLLTKIWEKTAKKETNGLFNFLRPHGISGFKELDAYSQINYGFKPNYPKNYSDFEGGGISPGLGNFFFPYLGGVQQAKQWTIRALMPY